MAGDHDWLGNDAKTRVERAVVALEGGLSGRDPFARAAAAHRERTHDQ